MDPNLIPPPELNMTDRAASDFFHSRVFKTIMIIIGVIAGSICLISICLYLVFGSAILGMFGSLCFPLLPFLNSP